MSTNDKNLGHEEPSPIHNRSITTPVSPTSDDAQATPVDCSATEQAADALLGAERGPGIRVEAEDVPDHLPEAVQADGTVSEHAPVANPSADPTGTAGGDVETTDASEDAPLSRFLNHLMVLDLDACSDLAGEIAEAGLLSTRKAVLMTQTVDNLKTFQRRWAAQELIAAHAAKAHAFYRDGDQAYVAWNGTIIPLHDQQERLYGSLRKDYGLPRSASALKGIGENLYQYAQDHGQQVGTWTLACYDQATKSAYLHNQDTEILEITAQGFRVVSNGTGGKLFLPDPSGKPIEVKPPSGPPAGDPFQASILGAARFGGGVLTHDQSALLCRAWFLAPLMTPEGSPRPILALIGPRGSGKSTLAARLGKAFIGPRFSVSLNHGGERDERIALTRKGFLVFDNLERISKRTEDNLCTAVTGGSVGLRILYTTNGYVDVPIRPWIVTTSQVMPSRRSDVLERCIFLPMERLSSFRSSMPSVTEPAVREALLQQLAWEAHQLIRRRAGGNWVEYEGGYRMPDFAALVVNLAEIRGQGDLGSQAIESLVDEVEAEQTLERPTIELIEFWLRKEGNAALDQEFTTRELCMKLEAIQKEAGVAFPEKGRPDKLGQFLTYHEVSLVQDFGFVSRRVGGRKRLVKFTRMPAA